MAVETFGQSLRAATAAPPPDCPPRDGPATADVAIVGAGILGLSLALHLAEAGNAVRIVAPELQLSVAQGAARYGPTLTLHALRSHHRGQDYAGGMR